MDSWFDLENAALPDLQTPAGDPVEGVVAKKATHPLTRILGDSQLNAEDYIARWIVNRGAE